MADLNEDPQEFILNPVEDGGQENEGGQGGEGGSGGENPGGEGSPGGGLELTDDVIFNKIKEKFPDIGVSSLNDIGELRKPISFASPELQAANEFALKTLSLIHI